MFGMFLGGLFVGLAGLLMLVAPDLVYTIKMAPRSKNPGEPSELYLITTRIGGGIFAVVGIVAIVYSLW